MVPQLRRAPSHDDQSGAIAVMFGTLSVVLLVVCALVVELGFAREQKQTSQVGADAAALAAANALYQTGGSTGCSVAPCFAQAVAAAQRFTATNVPSVSSSDWAGCTDAGHYYVYSGPLPSGTVATSCVSFANDAGVANSTEPTKVRVLMPVQDVDTPIGALAGVDRVSIQTAARAALQPGANRSCGLCLIGAGVSSVGNGDVAVTGASVHTNGSFDVGATGSVAAQPAGAVITAVNGCNQNCTPAATYAPTIADPYASADAMPTEPLTVKNAASPCGTSTLAGPGIYLADELVLPDGECVLQPGVYVVAGRWRARNNTMLRGDNVALYFTCKTATTPASTRPCASPGEPGGQLDVTNGNAQLSGRAVGETMAGFVLVYDRNNTSPLPMQGNGSTTYTGTIYAPQAMLTFPGNTDVTVVNGPVIVGSLYSNGTKALLNLTSATGVDIPVPPEAPRLDQ